MAAFNSQAEIEAGQAVWAKYCGFLTDYEIETALNNCIQMSDWSPNVSEFLRVALGYPDINQAVSRVINDDCSDVVSYEIRKQIGSWDIGHQTQTVIASRIRGLYDDAYLNAIEVKRGQ